VAVTSTIDTPPGAFSLQFRFSPANNGDPFRLLIVNESHPPAPMRMSLRWLTTNALWLQEPLRERFLGKFTWLQGQKLQLRPFIRAGRQTNYLYANWPPGDLPPDGEDLDFAGVKKRLEASAAPDAAFRLKLNRRLELLTNVGDYPLGTNFALKDQWSNFTLWTNTLPEPTTSLNPRIFT